MYEITEPFPDRGAGQVQRPGRSRDVVLPGHGQGPAEQEGDPARPEEPPQRGPGPGLRSRRRQGQDRLPARRPRPHRRARRPGPRLLERRRPGLLLPQPEEVLARPGAAARPAQPDHLRHELLHPAPGRHPGQVQPHLRPAHQPPRVALVRRLDERDQGPRRARERRPEAASARAVSRAPRRKGSSAASTPTCRTTSSGPPSGRSSSARNTPSTGSSSAARTTTAAISSPPPQLPPRPGQGQAQGPRGRRAGQGPPGGPGGRGPAQEGRGAGDRPEARRRDRARRARGVGPARHHPPPEPVRGPVARRHPQLLQAGTALPDAQAVLPRRAPVPHLRQEDGRRPGRGRRGHRDRAQARRDGQARRRRRPSSTATARSAPS